MATILPWQSIHHKVINYSSFYYRRAVEQLDAFVTSLIEERGATQTDEDDLLSILLEADMDNQEIRDQLVTFLLAGHETTALALTYTLYCLATHLDEQAAVIEEVTALDDRPTAAESLPRTDRAIKEAMRLYPPSHLLMREALEDDLVAGYRVSEGTLVICSQWATHRRNALYDEPEAFQPSRWETDDYLDSAISRSVVVHGSVSDGGLLSSKHDSYSQPSCKRFDLRQ